MIKNGRPYTNENGYTDDGLITSHSDKEVATVKKWIAENIMESNEILQGRTSYGLKHILEHDTGIYLTNNEFKDAMFMAGFKPVNPNEINWRYRIELKRFINNNPSAFFQWAKQFKDDLSPCGDFVKDMMSDFDFPTVAEHDAIENYLYQIGACRGAKDAFEKLWRAYERKNNRTTACKASKEKGRNSLKIRKSRI